MNLNEYVFTYIDVGARWGSSSARGSKLLKCFPKHKWLGFEPESIEFNVLCKDYDVYPFAIGKEDGSGVLNVTASPDWSSLYVPNTELLNQFEGFNGVAEVVNKNTIDIKPLDGFIYDADYLKIDAEGSALDVLRGAYNLLDSILGVEVEVEFVPLFKKQSLFGEIHELMMEKGFILFDLVPDRYFRTGFSMNIESKGQYVRAVALYFKDFNLLTSVVKKKVLFHVSLGLGFPDYSYDIANHIDDYDMFDVLYRYEDKRKFKRFMVSLLSKRVLRFLRRKIDANYDTIVSLGNPEYYFRRG